MLRFTLKRGVFVVARAKQYSSNAERQAAYRRRQVEQRQTPKACVEMAGCALYLGNATRLLDLVAAYALVISFAIFDPCEVCNPMKMPRQSQLQ
jgi:hypothetical protein